MGFYLLGTFLTFTLFDPLVAITAMLFLVLGDLSAALVGISFGRHKLVGSKSVEGTFAMFAVCVTICTVMFGGWHPLWDYVACSGALVACIAELFSDSIGIDDNFIIPVASGMALTIASARVYHQFDDPSLELLRDIHMGLRIS